MTDVIELSSDDDNCPVISNQNNTDSDTTVEDNIDDILNRYKLTTNHENTESTRSSKKETISSNSSSDSFTNFSELRSLRERLASKYKLPSSCENKVDLLWKDEPSSGPTTTSSTFDSLDSDESVNIEPSKPKKARATNKDKELKKLEKEQEKARKQAEKEQKKADAAKAKAEKQAIASAYKNLKPDECIKFITALIDSDLMSSECGTNIPNILQESNISYKINSNIHPFTVTWKRNNQAQLVNVDGQLQVTKNEDHCEEVLLFLMWNEFVTLIHEHKLKEHFNTIQSILLDKKIYLGIYGIENYFRAKKSQKQKLSAKEKLYLEAPKISRKDIDMCLIEIQLLYSVSHRFVETAQDVSSMVLQFTKSVAQKPFKLQKQQKEQQMEWFVAGDNKDCVRVDKNGNGLHRLWQQQLTQMSLARLETAESVTSKYPSPSSLMQAYDECLTSQEGEKLLQDIPIRRAAGPLTNQRKIGPEFSKKMHSLFTSLNGDVLL